MLVTLLCIAAFMDVPARQVYLACGNQISVSIFKLLVRIVRSANCRVEGPRATTICVKHGIKKKIIFRVSI
jgi:hypothetical protein